MESSRTHNARSSAPSYFPYPNSLYPLPEDLKHTLFAPGSLGILSALCCISMLSFILYRAVAWRAYYKQFVGANQYIALIVNLLVADLLQGLSFMQSFHWIRLGGIYAPTRTCFAQGFLLNFGDLASAFFVLGIALHTFYGAVLGRQTSARIFRGYVLFAWLFALLLSGIGPMVHPEDFYVRAGAWCWVNTGYQVERLALHYVWIFLVQFSTVMLYALVFIHLRKALRQMLPASHSSNHARVAHTAKIMLLFPAAYIVMTLPLSIGRMWSASHTGKLLPTPYLITAGSLIGSCGIVDCLLYTLTRRSLLRNSSNNHSAATCHDTSLDSNNYNDPNAKGIIKLMTVTVTGADGRMSMLSDDGALCISQSPPTPYDPTAMLNLVPKKQGSTKARVVAMHSAMASEEDLVTGTSVGTLENELALGRHDSPYSVLTREPSTSSTCGKGGDRGR